MIDPKRAHETCFLALFFFFYLIKDANVYLMETYLFKLSVRNERDEEALARL